MSTVTARTETRRLARPGRVVSAVLPLTFGAALVGSWQILASAGLADRFYFSRPTDIADRIRAWAADGSLFRHLAITLTEAAWALTIGVAAGLVAGLALARRPWLDCTFGPYLRMTNAVPRVVLAPIFVLWFGLGMWSKVALGVTLVFFVVFFNTYQGVRDVDPAVLDNARMLGASERQLIRHVLLPSAVTWIFSSLHVSVGYALVGAVVGEYLGATEGLGYVIAQAEGLFDTTGVFAGLIVLMAVVLTVDHLVGRLERRLLRWKRPQMNERSHG